MRPGLRGTCSFQEKPDIVNHHSAPIDVRRGACEPVFEASVNILGSITLREQPLLTRSDALCISSPPGQFAASRKRCRCPNNVPSTLSRHAASSSTALGIICACSRHSTTFLSSSSARATFTDRGKTRKQKQVSLRSFTKRCWQTFVRRFEGTEAKSVIMFMSTMWFEPTCWRWNAGRESFFNIASGGQTADYEVFQKVWDTLGLTVLNRNMPRNDRARWNGYTRISQRHKTARLDASLSTRGTYALRRSILPTGIEPCKPSAQLTEGPGFASSCIAMWIGAGRIVGIISAKLRPGPRAFERTQRIRIQAAIPDVSVGRFPMRVRCELSEQPKSTATLSK